MKHIDFEVDMPVKGYLLKFIRHVENLKEGEALDLIKSMGAIPYMLSLLLTNKTNMNRSMKGRSFEKIWKGYDAKIKFKVSYRMQSNSKFYFEPKSIQIFDRFLHRLFHDFLLDKILKGIGEGKNEKDIIYDFLAELDIEEDVRFETIKKASYRLRKSKKIPTFYQQLRPGGLEPENL